MMCFHIFDLMHFFNLIRREGAPPTKSCKQRAHWFCCGRRALAAKRFSKPVHACREAQDEPEFSGRACLSAASSHPAGSFEHRREAEGQACGCFWYSFGVFI